MDDLFGSQDGFDEGQDAYGDLFSAQSGIIDLPMDWDLLSSPVVEARLPDTADLVDWMFHSLATYGRVDLLYIADALHIEYTDVILGLRGKIYQNPETWEQTLYKGWEPADLYLSGNLRRKLKIAEEATREYPGQFDENVRALTAAMPEVVRRSDIFITLGSPWVPTEIIDAFVRHLLGDPPCRKSETIDDFRTRHDTLTGTWEIPYKSRYNRPEYQVQMCTTYGTSRMNALQLLEHTLNMRTATITDEVRDPNNPKKFHNVVNREETVLACEMQEQLIALFQDWVWNDHARREMLEDIFDRQYGCVLPRRFDGSFLRFPGMASGVHLFPHQKNAVARILLSPNTLLAHDVGAGKTYIMVAAGMELRRMGISKKNLYVLPNNLLGQWAELFHTLYADAKLLCVDRTNFTPKKKEATLREMRDGDYDAILITYSAFEKIPLSRTYYKESIAIEQAAVEEALGKDSATENLSRRKKHLAKKLEDLEHPERKHDPMRPLDDGALLLPMGDLRDAHFDDENGVAAPIFIPASTQGAGDASQTAQGGGPIIVERTVASVCFDDLKIGTLFVDEAHNFKNVPLETKIEHVHGISASGSAKCKDMLDKVRCVQRANGGRGVIMATGTPITNSITDVFVMQNYLQGGELSLLDLQSFDSWIGMFAERATEFEVDVDTNNYRLVSRFSKFHNLSVLTTLLSYIADFHAMDASDGLPAFEGYKDIVVPRTRPFTKYLAEISARAEEVRSGTVCRMDDNMLKITNDGRKAALDLRLVCPTERFTFQSKVGMCAAEIYRIYLQGTVTRTTQLLFCDTSTPKKGQFNIYEDMERLLVRMGIPPEEIAFVHEATTEKKRSALFAAVKAGDIRVLIGSTFKLGVGVNVQDRLVAIHHLDVPWRPADMVQREGRILRRGNQNKQVEIYRYITEGSFDAYSWQLLETKQRFIAGLLSGSLSEKSASDIEGTILSYAEIKALAIGNPVLKKRIEVANRMSRLLILQRKAEDSRMLLEQELSQLPETIAHRSQLIAFCKTDMAFLAEDPTRPDAEERALLADKLAAAVERSLPIDPDVKLFVYRGFEVTLPHGTDRDKPAVFLGRAGKYYVTLGADERIYLDFIDRFLAGLSDYLAALEVGLASSVRHKAEIEQELEKTQGYTAEIEACRRQIEELDKELGVKEE